MRVSILEPPCKGISIYFQTITQRKRAEQRQQAQYAVTRVLAEATTLADSAQFPLAQSVRTGVPIFLESTEAIISNYPNMAELLPLTGNRAVVAITRQFGGLGLGLAIVRYLTELHGGSVFAESLGEGIGATFTVRLPLIVGDPEVTEEKEQFFGVVDLRGLRILVVDDEADIRELVAFILEQSGAEVSVATSASNALTALNQSVLDVLVSDIGMPGVDGYMLMRQVRTLSPEQGGQIPAITLTAYAGEYNQQQALAAGFQLHLAKPVEPEELVNAIARLVGRD